MSHMKRVRVILALIFIFSFLILYNTAFADEHSHSAVSTRTTTTDYCYYKCVSGDAYLNGDGKGNWSTSYTSFTHSLSGWQDGENGERHKSCSKCGTIKESHVCADEKVYTYVDDAEHSIICDKCDYDFGNANHSFSASEVERHYCATCDSYMKNSSYKHGFDENTGKCLDSARCSAKMDIDEVDPWVENGEHWTSYMVFDSTPPWTESQLQDKIKVSWNHKPYTSTSKDDTTTFPIYIVMEGETYKRHNGEETIKLNENTSYFDLKLNFLDQLGISPTSYTGAFFINNVLDSIQLGDYNTLPSILTGTLGSNPAIRAAWDSINDVQEYTRELPSDGPYTDTTLQNISQGIEGRLRIQRICIKNGNHQDIAVHEYSDGGRLFTDTEPDDPVKYYGFLNLGYRDTKGNKIPGSIRDYSMSGLIYYGSNGYHTASFSGTVDLETLDKYGWRYVGYKIKKNTTGISGALTEEELKGLEDAVITDLGGALTQEQIGDLIRSEKFSTTCEMKDGEIFKSITFYFEPVKITVKHINKNRAEIPTNKSGLTYEIPKEAKLAGHKCDKLNCDCETISGGIYTSGDTYVIHNNTSLNKYLWPGYVLMDYQITSNTDGSTLGSRTYDTSKTATITDYNGITTHALKAQEIPAGAEVPTEVYRKNIALKSDFTIVEGDTDYVLTHTTGYMPDFTLTFNYENVDVTVEHRAWEDEQDLLKSTNDKDLIYTQILNGHFFDVPSLFTSEDHVLYRPNSSLPAEGLPYNISGRVIKRLDLYKRNETEPIWSKEFSFEQKENGTEPISADNLLYYVLTSNDIKEYEIINEINRIGNDIRFVYYYEKVPTLTVKHVDEQGFKLWPTEHLILGESGVKAKSKDLTSYNYVYKEYTLDGTLGHSEVVDESNSNVVSVLVPRNGLNDRELIYVYKESYPVLKVKYVNEQYKDIANPLPDIKMTTENHKASAIDLSGLGYEYTKYELYDGADRDSGLDKTGSDVTVNVQRNGNNRILYFIYIGKASDVHALDIVNVTGEAVLLRSNERGDSEEYNAARAIPTSEDLYANVITDSFLISNAITQEDKVAKIKVKLVQPYFITNDADSAKVNQQGKNKTDKPYAIESSNYITVNMPYSYVAAKNVQLDLISRAVVKNEAIEVRDDNGNIIEEEKVTIFPNYPKKPTLEYTAGGELVFKDLATTNMEGMTVAEYINGLAEGEYNLSEGFYNVKVNELAGHNFEYEVEYILPEIQYTEVTREMMDEIELQYKSSPSLLTDACEKNDVRVKMDKLYVNDVDYNNNFEDKLVMILSGLALPINREYTALTLDKKPYGLEPDPTALMADLHPEASLIGKDVLYKNDQIYISKDKENKDYDTTCDVYYLASQKVNPDTHEVEDVDDHEIFITAHNFDINDPEAWRDNKEILINSKTNIVGNKVFVHTPVVNSTMIVQSNSVLSHIKNIFIGDNDVTSVSNSNKNEFVVYTYKDIYNLQEDINQKLKNQIKGVESLTSASISKVVEIDEENAHKENTSIQSQLWNGGVNPVSDDVNKTTNDVKITLLLGSTFDVFIPHEGTHKDEVGYGRNTYNYGGLNANNDGFNKLGRWDKDKDETFAWKKQIKFSFDVFNTKTNELLEKNKWNDLELGDELYQFAIAENNVELWQNNRVHTIDTRVIAENANGTKISEVNSEEDYDDISQLFFNKERENYIATNHFDVRIIGDIRDFEVRATTDEDWKVLKESLTDHTDATLKLPLGQLGQNSNAAYNYGIKLGDAVYFDIATNGWYGDTSDNINIVPKYYFIGNDGGVAEEVDLYYKQSSSGPYLNIIDSPYGLSTVMSLDVARGNEFKSSILLNKLVAYSNNSSKELSTTDLVRKNVMNDVYEKWVNKYRGGVINYSQRIDLGNTKNVKLPYNTRLAYYDNLEKMIGVESDSKYKVASLIDAQMLASSLTGSNYCIGHWYGALELPSSTIAMQKNEVPDITGSNRLKDGYIIVGFSKITTTSSGSDYLRYEPTKLTFKLPNGTNVELPPNTDTPPSGPSPEDPIPSIPVVIYDLIPNTVKYGTEMSH